MAASNKETVFETEWFNVEQEYFCDMRSLGGKPYYRVNCPDGVMVLALTGDEEIILVRQFRPAISKHTLELPAGSIDRSESPEQAAARELYEETGYVCESLSFLGQGRTMLNRMNCRQFVFLGTGAIRDSEFECAENIDVVMVSPAQFRNLVRSGEFESFSALALFVLADWKLGRKLVT